MKNWSKRFQRELTKRILSGLQDPLVQRGSHQQLETVQSAVEDAFVVALVEQIWSYYDNYGDPTKQANGIVSKR